MTKWTCHRCKVGYDIAEEHFISCSKGIHMICPTRKPEECPSCNPEGRNKMLDCCVATLVELKIGKKETPYVNQMCECGTLIELNRGPKGTDHGERYLEALLSSQDVVP